MSEDKKSKKEAKAELIAHWDSDPIAMCQEAFSFFDSPFTSIHTPITDLLFDETIKKKLMLAPRGIGKTTLCRAKSIRNICLRKSRFIVYISATSTMAEMQTENIKYELMNNELLLDTFGDPLKDQSTVNKSDASDFSKKAWVAYGHTMVLPRGCGQQIRGLNWRGARPDLYVIDDLEDMDEIRSEDSRLKTRSWFLSDVSESYDKLKKNYEMCYIDSLKSFDALPVHLMRMADWRWTNQRICDTNFESLAPEFMSTEEVREKMDILKKDGMIDLFYREYMGLPIAPESAAFRQEYFKYVTEAGEMFTHTNEKIPGVVKFDKLETVILVDPAKSLNPTSDDSAVVAVSMDLEAGRYYVREIFAEKVNPDELYENIIRLALKYKSQVIGLEVNSLNTFITFPFENELKRRNLQYMEIVELKPSGKKEERISSLISFYRKGEIFHNKEYAAKLEMQLLTHGASEHDDVADALAYLVQLLSKGGRYFHIRRIDKALPEPSEYAELENDKPIEWEYAV